MRKINYKSDFDFILRMKDCTDEEKTVAFPDGDFDARFWTSSKANAYTASCKDGVYTNCFRTEDGGMHFVFDDHRMGKGRLEWEPHFELPNDIYPDNMQDIFRKAALDIELVDGDDDCPTTADVEAMLPYIKGEPFSYEDFTEEQLEDIRRPGVEAAVVALRAAGEAEAGAETARQAAERAKGVTESMLETEQAVTDAEAERGKAEQIRQTDEAARRQAEQERKTEFEGWHDTIESKADRTELSNLISEPADNALEDLDATLVTEALRKVPQALTPKEQEQVKANLAISKMELFCDLFNAAAGDDGYARILDGKFDGMLNGLPLTYEEAVAVYVLRDSIYARQESLCRIPVRTNMPRKTQWLTDLTRYAQFNRTVEVLNLPNSAFGANLFYAFYGCTNLREIYGLSHNGGEINKDTFNECRKLERLEIRFLRCDLNLQWSPLLSLASLQYMVANASNTTAITITVHPDVYAKLTDAANTEWHALLALGAEKDIIFATV